MPVAEIDTKITIPKQYFKLRGPLVTATHVEVVLGEALKRLESVRVNSIAVESKLQTILTGDPAVDRLAYLAHGALDQLGYTFDDFAIILNNSETYKIRVYGVREKPSVKKEINKPVDSPQEVQ